MSGKLVRLATLFGVILMVVTTAAFAQSDANVVFPGYHGFSNRAGQNPDATQISNPGDLTLIWTYPRTQATATASDNMIDQPVRFNPLIWTLDSDATAYPLPGPSSFLYATAINTTDPAVASVLAWGFPATAPQNAPAGRYRVYVWYPAAPPAGRTATTAAVYTVFDKNSTYTYSVDQSKDGGKWVQIGNIFEFNDATGYVSVSNKTDDGDGANVVVMGDGVRFLRDTATPEAVVDDSSATGFIQAPVISWTAGLSTGTTGLVSGSCYNSGFHYRKTSGAAATANWVVPADTPSGKYLVYAWFPSTYENNPTGLINTTAARYTAGGSTFIVDQNDPSSGGVWKLLSSQAVTLNPGGLISVSNQTSDSTSSTIVVADAIKLVPATGSEIYSSPVAGEVPVDWDFGADGKYKALIPVVYTSTVEPPLVGGEDPQDVGSIICVNGVTPVVTGTLSALDEKLKLSLGTALWEYPSGNASLRGPLEGPVQNGFYSTPTLAYWLDTSVTSNVRRAVLVATGMDGQIYCLDAEGTASADKSITTRKAKLLWKGPGLTVSEPYTGGPYPNPAPGLWQTVTGRNDSYGGQFLAAICSAPDAPGAPIVWHFEDLKRQAAGEPSTDGKGWAYNVSVWIPALGAGVGGKLPAMDAVYKVTYQTTDVAPAVQTVTVNLSEAKNQGRWVSLGKFFNVSQVELATTTKQATPANYAVVADACMIVPEQIGAFGYSSPVTDINKYENKEFSENGRLVYAVTADGRAMSMNITPVTFFDTGEQLGKVNWFYPAIRENLVVAGSADETKAGLGPVVASATYVRGAGMGAPARLLLASTDHWGGSGNVYCLTGVEYGTVAPPTLNWTFPSVTTDSDRPLSFSSSPAVSGSTVYIGTEYGSVFGLNLEKALSGVSQATWKYPDSDTGVPLGAFRYSTPAFATADGVNRVWISSADGKIYSFNADTGARMFADSTGASQYYVEPSLRSAVYGSVAVDGRNALIKPEVLYVGSMAEQGVLRWYLARSGMVGSEWKSFGWPALGPIFGSPAPAQTRLRADGHVTPGSGPAEVNYVYFTAQDGRVYALSPKYNSTGGSTDTAWGGGWAGGGWLYDSVPGENPLVEPPTSATGSDVQFEVLNPTFFETSYNSDPEPRDVAVLTAPATWDTTDWIVRRDMKLLAPADVPAAATNALRDKNLITLLSDRAKAVRGITNMLFDTKANRTDPNGRLYVEWGESIYLALWNLNPDDLKAGQSSVVVQLHNGSAGSGAGMELTAKVKAYKEYTLVDSSKPSGTGYEPLKYFAASTKNVRRAYLLAQVDLKASGSKPPTPGPGWELYAKISNTTGEQTIDLAKLVIGAGGIPVPEMKPLIDPGAATYTSGANAPATQYIYDKLAMGINNPLAIRDDGSGRDINGNPNNGAVKALAWGLNRYDRHAHFNGNSRIDEDAVGVQTYNDGHSTNHLPILYVKDATHGAVTPPRNLGIMDRSAGGAHKSGMIQQISNFRIGTWDLSWNGGEGAISSKAYDSINAPAFGYKFGWEYGIGSVDYPDVLVRYQQFRTTMDGKDPARAQTVIPCVQAAAAPNEENYSLATDRYDQVEVTVEVPRFQPANTTNDGIPLNLPARGYSRVMTAYIDSNRNGGFDSGTVRLGRPTTYQEAYRNFRYDLTVAPDPKVEVKETLVDVGLAPHGLGESMGWDFYPFTAEPMWSSTLDGVGKWFKTLTVRNLGNVNLYRLRVDKSTMLLGDGARYPILGENITSSLDQTMLGNSVQLSEPMASGGLGYTLTKARVGDPDPTTLTIPDRRKWNVMSAADKATAQAALRGVAPVQPMISVRVPISQPVGTYVAKGVRVYSDMDSNNNWYAGEKDWNGDGILDSSEDLNGNNILDAAEPSTDPSIDLKIAIRENQLTGGVISTSLTQIDSDSNSRVADGGPAAFRDANGAVNLFFVSNRRSDPPTGSLYPDWNPATNDSKVVEFSRAPMFINQAVLNTNAADPANPWRVFWRPTGTRWWDAPFSGIPSFQWPDIDPIIYGSGSAVPFWKFGNTDTDRLLVRHTSPAVGTNEDNGNAYIVWAGSADIARPTPDRYRTNEERIFFTPVTGGTVANTAAGIRTISSKPNVAKRSPSVAAWGSASESIAVLWQGMMGNRWGIYFNASADGVNWTEDAQVRTSDGLSVVGSPNAVHRSVNKLDESASSFRADMVDMIYSGTGKITRNSDILLSRYAPVTDIRSMVSPTKRALPLPRVYSEKLSFVAKYGFYTSEHTAWMRLDNRFDTPILDRWNNGGVDIPFIHVVLGDGYEPAYPAGTVVSVTDGSISGVGGTAIRPKVDSVTGVYTYEYATGTPAYDILGKSFVDFAEGVVKFTRPLKNASSGSGASKPEVYADYTPQTWRLTTDLASDSSPRAFIERTQMTPGANPGMGNSLPSSVDRLWVMWRKASAGAKGNVIYYKTYRMGVDLKTIGANPIRINSGEQDLYESIPFGGAYPAIPNPHPLDLNLNGVRDRAGSLWAPITVNGIAGSYEVDATGTKIYFNQADERYPAMDRLVARVRNAVPADPGRSSVGLSPGSITLTYEDINGAIQPVTVDTVFWIPEIAEQSLTGSTSSANVNEGSIWAFADPNPPQFMLPGETSLSPLSKIWLFWTSTRQDNTDLFWETVFPGLTVK